MSILSSYIQEIIDEVRVKKIQVLSFSGISLIPEEFFVEILKFNWLKELHLVNCGITNLPADISNLYELHKLNLSDNNIKNLPESISELSNLYELRCPYNSLREIPEGISNLPKLTLLSLAGNNFQTFPGGITRLRSLRELRISHNQIEYIPENIGDISSLEYFSISYNQIRKIPESFSNLSNLSYLSLRNNKILELPDIVRNLPKLKTLKISSNPCAKDLDEKNIKRQRPKSRQRSVRKTKIQQSPPVQQSDVHNKIEEVKEKKLKSLDLSGKNLQAFPTSIFELNWLEELDVSNNQITELPIELLELSNLSKLNIDDNPLVPPLSDLSKEGLSAIFQYLDAVNKALYQIGKAKDQNLFILDLSNLNLVDVPDDVFELSWLEELDLSNNQIKLLPFSLLNLSKLSKLNLENNPLTEPLSRIVEKGVGAVFQYLDLRKRVEEAKSRRLKTLDLSGLDLTSLPFDILEMNWLEELDLSNNKLIDLPDDLFKIANLKSLILFRNQISSLPKTFTQLNKLRYLNLSGNQLRELPVDFGKLVSLDSLNLTGNPLEVPPIEVAKQGIKSIAQYFNQLGEAGKSYLYEAKLLLVGEPGAGKTTLARKLKNPTAPLPSENESTKGIDIITWGFPQLDKPDFRVNIWDFAGQEIYYATHRFFLTHNALYLLVADTRKDDTYFDYWLNIISLLSQNSPVLIIANEKDDRYRHFNINTLRGYFSNLKDIFRTNLANRRGLQEIYKAIEHYISNLPHVGKVLPSTWVRVREALEKTQENYISAGKFFHICEREGFKQNSDKLQLSDYLHTIGVILHYQNDPILKNTIFLNPEWCTSAIYKALDTKEIIKNNGLFTKTYLAKIWKDTQYSQVLDELLQLMTKFNLCYPLPSTTDTYIVPQLLPEDRMPFEWDENENLHLQYEYKFMPKGMLWQFIIAVHTYIKEQVYVWRSGVIITKDGATAEIIEHYHSRLITVRIFGKNKRDLMSIIRYEFEKIHDIYHQLEYTELVPCNCTSCRDSDSPHFYDIRELLERVQNKKDRIECRKKPYNMVKVRELLDDILDYEHSDIVQEHGLIPYAKIENAYFQGTNPIYTSKDVDMTKNITIKDVHGATINIDTVFENVNQIIDNFAGDNQKEKSELDELIKQLKLQLSNVPLSKEDELDKITKRLDAFLKEAADKKPDKDVVQVNGESLIKAARNLESVTPSVLSIAKKIVEFMTLLAFRS